MAAATTLSPEQRSLRSRLGGLATASKHDPREYTAPARAQFHERFVNQVDPDRTLPEAERDRRARAALRAHMAQLAYRSARSRSRRGKAT